MHGETVRWDSAGPRRVKPRVVLVRPGPGETIRAVIISARIVGLWLHWYEGRSVPCLGEDSGCPLHVGGEDWDMRWKGFAACVTSRTFLPAGQVLEVTADAWTRCPMLQQLSDAGRMRGVEVEVSRANKGQRSRCGVAVRGGGAVVSYHDALPPEFSVKDSLSILFPRIGREQLASEGSNDETEDDNGRGLRGAIPLGDA